MALLASIGAKPMTKRYEAKRALKQVEVELKRVPSEATAEEVIEVVVSVLKSKLGVTEPKKKAKKAE